MSGGLNLSATMDALAAAFLQVTGVTRSFAYPTEDILPGDAIVTYPRDPGQIGVTFDRGSDRATFSVVVICGLSIHKSTRDLASQLILNAGSDVFSKVDGDLSGAVQTASVTQFSIEPYAGKDGAGYIAVRFSVDIYA